MTVSPSTAQAGPRPGVRRPLTIRSHLLLLALAAVLPVLAFALFASSLLVRHDQQTQRSGALDRARAMMTAVDAELRGSVATLQALAASRALAKDDLAGFHAAAGNVLRTQPSWLNVALSRPDGEQILNIAAPPDAAPVPAEDPASVERVARTLQPAIGDVVTANILQIPAVPVRVPVIRGGAAAYVLTALVRPDSFAELIRQQHLPEGWVSGIVDGQHRFVTRVPPRPAGGLSSESFRAAVTRAPEGWYRGTTVEGIDTFTAHKTSHYSGWSIGLAIPSTTVDRAARKSAWVMAVGTLVSIGLAFAATLLIGRRVADPVRSLAAAARSLGSGENLVVAKPGTVREVADVAAALREAAIAVRERQRLLEREKEALQAADVAKNEFLAMLSHELRNPLAAMSSAAHLLKVLDPGHPGTAQARAVIDRQTRHMTRLIEDLLDITRITMGKASLQRQRFDLAEAVSNVVEGWRGSGRFGSRVLELNASAAWVDGDRARVEQIVANLLDNAVKFTPEGRKITVTVRREDANAVLAVADEGEGIVPELKDRIFELFVQGPHGIDRGKGGMGIGLALVKKLAEMHRGAISVASEGPGRGATFTLHLPSVEGGDVKAAAAPRAAAGSRRILIIEDNDDAREMLREALSLSGHEVKDARDGESGIALAERSGFEVVLIDIGLPDMDGYEVARRLRAGTNGAMTLIALTGYGQIEDQRQAFAAGFDAHLTKPVDTERLQAAIAGFARRAAPPS